MKNLLLFLLFIPIVFSCNTAPEETTEEILAIDSITVENDFDIFFERFKEDPAFQLENVKFPYSIEMWEVGEDKPEVEKIFKDEWQHLPFQYDESYATRKTDAYKQQIVAQGDTIKVQLRGVDNGIAVDYEFVKINGQWLLVAEKDFSS